jgi:hypothetical protein
MTTAFSDYQITVVDQVAEGDKVATVWTAQGTHQPRELAEPMGATPSSGRSVTWTGTIPYAFAMDKLPK